MEKYIQLSREDVEDAKQRVDFQFNWTNEIEKGRLVIGLYHDEELVGLVSFVRHRDLFNKLLLIEVLEDQQKKGFGGKLLAIVMWDSFLQPDNDGFVQLKSKKTDVETFYRHLGAIEYGQNKIFQTNESLMILKRYLPEGGEIQWITKK
ncbi:MAG: GNAT family N-acetyltransferase [Lactobacillaceae bacterium]|jgi:hypothetical protein|nr:GNAT family N-acetyltransferase [Lactobacillaceae bacterium]